MDCEEAMRDAYYCTEGGGCRAGWDDRSDCGARLKWIPCLKDEDVRDNGAKGSDCLTAISNNGWFRRMAARAEVEIQCGRGQRPKDD
jgi:hypothetical protein